MKMRHAIQRYLRHIEVKTSPGNLKYNKEKLPIIEEFFGEMEVNDITEDDLLEFVVYYRDENPDVSNIAINKRIQITKRIIKLTSKRIIEFDKLPENRKTREAIDPQVRAKVFGYLSSQSHIKESMRNLVFFRLILDTGLRLSEALQLRVRDIDVPSRTIHVKHTKTNMERYVFFTKSTGELIKRLVGRDQLSGRLFINYKTGEPVKIGNIQKMCQRMEKRLKLKQHIRPHRWRHTFATSFTRRGGDLESLRLMMGHTSLKTTQIYLHLNRDDLEKEYFKIFKDK